MMKRKSKKLKGLDVGEPLPVVNWKSQEDMESAQLTVPKLPELASTMYSSEEEELPIREIISNKAQKRRKFDIPVPVIKEVADYDEILYEDFERPKNYLDYDDTHFGYNRYDMDEIDDDDGFLCNLIQQQIMITEDQYEHMIEELEIETLHNNNEIPTLSRVEHMFPDITLSSVHRVYYHWLDLRDNVGRPVLFSYALQKPVELPKRRRRRNKLRDFEKMKKLRLDLEKARVILDMVKKREKLKKEHLEAYSDIITKTFSNLNDLQPPLKKVKSPKREDAFSKMVIQKRQHTPQVSSSTMSQQRRNSIEIMKIQNLLNTD